HHPRHAGADQRLGAGTGASVMAAGLQGDVGGSAPRPFAGLAQGVDLGVRLAGALVPAFADDLAVAHDHAADTRIGMGGEQPQTRQPQRPGHEGLVGRAHGWTGVRSRSISSRNSSRSLKRRYTEAKRM